ncbi:MAG: cobyrinate a,c-diamide synthase [Lachnospiraceae bacterium]|nr:cobyrinate a,c-diamide synthase [Lachnospiraceae bacterium]
MKKIMFAGTASSSGKTTISCGFMKALVDRGLKVASFKCGPDYIDPMFHEQIVGTRAGNLDGFFLKKEELRKMLRKNSAGCDIAVLEGVMGCYDGIGFTREASGYEVATATDTPIVLIANVRGMAASMTALVRGFLEEDREERIRGVILNQLPAKLFPEAKRAMETLRPGLICYGYVPVNRALELKSRHLGLVTPGEISDMKEKVSLAAGQVEETVDVEGLIRLAGEAEVGFGKSAGEAEDVFRKPTGEAEVGFGKPDGQSRTCLKGTTGRSECAEREITGQDVNDFRRASEQREDSFTESSESVPDCFVKLPGLRIAVAKDRAFSFLYRDNLNWLAEHGAEPVFFSPLEDREIPDGCGGLILPGGYPELYLDGLEKNASMRMSVRQAIAGGMPTIAECGGFLYLLDRVEGQGLSGDSCQTVGEYHSSAGDSRQTAERYHSPAGSNCQNAGEYHRSDGDSRQTAESYHSLAGVIHQTGRNSRSLGRFGYICLTAQTDGLLAAAGETIRAHEFHHYTTDDDGHGFRADKASGTGSWETGYHTGTLYAGFPHIYFPGNERAGERFLAACARY